MKLGKAVAKVASTIMQEPQLVLLAQFWLILAQSAPPWPQKQPKSLSTVDFKFEPKSLFEKFDFLGGP